MSFPFASKAVWASFALGVGNLAYLDFVLVPAYLRQFGPALARSAPSASAEPGAVRAPAPAGPQAPAGPPTKTATKQWVVLFGFGSSALNAQARATLADVLASHRTNPGVVDIAGYTDTVGDPAYNAYLSRARATAVAGWLSGRGIQADRINLKGYGAKQGKRASRRDRRVEIRLRDR